MFVNTASNYEHSDDDDDDQSMVSLRMGRTMHRTYMGRRSGCSQPFVLALLAISCFIFLLFQIASVVPRKAVPPNFAWAANASRNITLYIRPNEVTALLQPKNFCQPNPFILFVVPSAVNNTKERVAIRRTWGQWANTHASRVLSKEESPKKNNHKSPLEPYVHPAQLSKLVFLLGKSRGQNSISSSVLEESRLYGDIVVEDFVDSYTNLTLKSVFMLKWVHQNCPNVNFVMKVDDDIFVNVLNLEQALMNKTVAKTPLLLGTLICDARPIHDQWSKWYTPKYMFREGKYPNYLSGTGYVISGDIVNSLLKAALSTEYFHLEDVFITGLCAKSIGVHASDHPGFSYQPRAISACLYRDVIMGHGVVPSQMVILWNRMNHPTSFEKCHPIKKSKLRSHPTKKCTWR